MIKVFLWHVDNDFNFLNNIQPYTVEPTLTETEEVEIPNELWERWNKVKNEFNAVQQELVKYLDD